MKKLFKHDELDPHKRCEICRKPLKKNLLAKKPNASKCYKDFSIAEADRGHKMVDARTVRTTNIMTRFMTRMMETEDYKRLTRAERIAKENKARKKV